MYEKYLKILITLEQNCLRIGILYTFLYSHRKVSKLHFYALDCFFHFTK